MKCIRRTLAVIRMNTRKFKILSAALVSERSWIIDGRFWNILDIWTVWVRNGWLREFTSLIGWIDGIKACFLLSYLMYSKKNCAIRGGWMSFARIRWKIETLWTIRVYKAWQITLSLKKNTNSTPTYQLGPLQENRLCWTNNCSLWRNRSNVFLSYQTTVLKFIEYMHLCVKLSVLCFYFLQATSNNVKPHHDVQKI